MILRIKRKIRLSETDATGIIYFTNLLKFGCEIFEDYLHSKFKQQGETFQTSSILLPIVDVKASFVSQITIGDEITVILEKVEAKQTSLTTKVRIEKEGRLVANVCLVHVVLSRETKKKVPIEQCKYLLYQESCSEV